MALKPSFIGNCSSPYSFVIVVIGPLELGPFHELFTSYIDYKWGKKQAVLSLPSGYYYLT